MSEASTVDARRLPCAWCEGPIPPAARSDSKFCGVRCRQASHRFYRGAARDVAAGHPLRLAYADPPYPGLARRYYADHPDYAGEVDHRALLERLAEDFPDGWALSTSAAALPDVLASCRPGGVRVAAWFRGERPTRSYSPLSAWEPVVYAGGRALAPSAGEARRLDALVHHARPRLTDPRRVVGAKLAAFCWWLLALLGARPGDDLVDLFPGSGGMGRAMAYLSAGDRPDASPEYSYDASPPPRGHASPGDGDDAPSRPDPPDASRLAVVGSDA